MPGDPITIDSDRLLLVEGKATGLVLGSLCRHFGIQGFQIINFGSKDNFKNFIAALKKSPAFPRVLALAIVRDAEENAAGAFASVRDALSKVGLRAPLAGGEISDDAPKVGVFIVPDNREPGMIETLCVRSVAEDPAYKCVEAFFECVVHETGISPKNRHKARAQAFLAARPQLEHHIGRAADEGIWKFDHPAFASLVEFLRQCTA